MQRKIMISKTVNQGSDKPTVVFMMSCTKTTGTGLVLGSVDEDAVGLTLDFMLSSFVDYKGPIDPKWSNIIKGANKDV